MTRHGSRSRRFRAGRRQTSRARRRGRPSWRRSLSARDLVRVGRVGRPHGRDGSFVVEEASTDPARFTPGAVLVVDGGEVVVVASKQAGGRPVVRVDRELPRGCVLSVHREQLAPPAEGSYYVADLVGLAVEEEGGRPLGRVHEVAPGVANDVLELESGLSLPLHEACVLDVDLERRTIVVARGFADAG